MAYPASRSPTLLRLTRDEIVHFQGERVAMRLDAKQEPTVRMINSVLFSLLSGDLAQLDTLFEVDGATDDNSWKVALKPREPALAKAIGDISLDGGAYVKNITSMRPAATGRHRFLGHQDRRRRHER